MMWRVGIPCLLLLLFEQPVMCTPPHMQSLGLLSQKTDAELWKHRLLPDHDPEKKLGGNGKLNPASVGVSFQQWQELCGPDESLDTTAEIVLRPDVDQEREAPTAGRNKFTIAEYRSDVEFSKGNEAVMNGDLELAIQHYSKALEINPNVFEAHFNLGEVYKRIDKHNESMWSYSRAAETAEVAIPKTFNNQMLVLDTRTTVEAKNNAVKAYTAAGRAALKAGDLAFAEGSFAAAVVVRPQDPDLNLYVVQTAVARESMKDKNDASRHNELSKLWSKALKVKSRWIHS